MICPKCNTGEMRCTSFLGHNWQCELCGYTEWSPTYNSPGDNSYSGYVPYDDWDNGSTYSSSDSFSSSVISGSSGQNISTSYHRKRPKSPLGKINAKLQDVIKEKERLSRELDEIKKSKKP